MSVLVQNCFIIILEHLAGRLPVEPRTDFIINFVVLKERHGNAQPASWSGPRVSVKNGSAVTHQTVSCGSIAWHSFLWSHLKPADPLCLPHRGTRPSSVRNCSSCPALRAWSPMERSSLIRAPPSWPGNCLTRTWRSQVAARMPIAVTASSEFCPSEGYLIDLTALKHKPTFCQYLYVRI